MGTYQVLLNLGNDLTLSEVEARMDAYAQEHPSSVSMDDLQTLSLLKKAYPENFSWHYFEISTENNLSWYAAFRMLYEITGREIYAEAMLRIEDYFRSSWDREENYFYQGMHYHDGQWVPNTETFATDVQNWAITVLGPKKIDSWFGAGASYRLWEQTKAWSGAYDEQGLLRGVGFTVEADRISIEWTAGAILALRYLEDYYRDKDVGLAQKIHQDSANMRSGMESFRIELPDHKAAYAYSSKRGWIPFGWFSHSSDVLSMASTCWMILIDQGIDPFILTK